MICKCGNAVKGRGHSSGLCHDCRNKHGVRSGHTVDVFPLEVDKRIVDMEMADDNPESELSTNELFVIHKCRSCDTEKVLVRRLCMCLACLDKAYMKLVTRKTE